MCIYVHICIYMFVHVNIYILYYIYIYVSIYVCTYVCMVCCRWTVKICLDQLNGLGEGERARRVGCVCSVVVVYAVAGTASSR